MLQRTEVVVSLALLFIGIAALTGSAAAIDEDHPDCAESSWEDWDDTCNEVEYEEDDAGEWQEQTNPPSNSEDDPSCSEASWLDTDEQCDRWSDTNDGSATSEMYQESDSGGIDHPVESAIKFQWYKGGDFRLDAGPQACIDLEEVGGKHEFVAHKEEYADYIMENGHSSWQRFTTKAYIENEIERHRFEWDGSACIVVWERGFGHTPGEKPNWFDRDDWDDPDS